jgi:dihydrofolate reductase
MSKVTCDITISVDGFVAGPQQSLQNPLGKGGERLHYWQLHPEGEDQRFIDDWQGNAGAYIMGRNMFDPGRGEWDPDWVGWWGDEPPYHVPVFVLTHHPRPDLSMAGGTIFHFVTDGIQAALERARSAAGGKDVAIAGGASTVNACLAANLIDELRLHIAPVLLGAGERLFGGVTDLDLDPVQVVGSPAVTHVSYRLGRKPSDG